MKIVTRNFGEIEICEEDIIDFYEGLPGFKECHRFALLSEKDSPIAFLQSTEDGEVSFVVVDATAYMPNYNPHVDESFIAPLGSYNPDTFLIYNIATVSQKLEDSTVNLKAPIVINAASKKGRQIICEDKEYSIKAPLFADKGEKYAGINAQKR